MIDSYKPEGALYFSAENQAALATISGLERAMQNGTVIEGIATLCDSDLRLHVDLKCAHGILEPDEVVFCRAGESRKDIAIVSRVGKPIAVRILSMERRGEETIVHLSRKKAQEDCIRHYLSTLRPGDLIDAKEIQKVNHCYGHYTILTHYNSRTTSANLLAYSFHLQIYPSQAVGS